MTAHELLEYYKLGYFPMAKHRDDIGFDIVAPYMRALLPIHTLHVPKRLRRKILQFPFRITVDTAFDQVIKNCAEVARHHESGTWINDDIIALYTELHHLGYAHSIECWDGDRLVGGLYGVVMGSTFCGESMFSLETDASKIALVHLCARLNAQGFKLLDSQFRNPHLDQFGLYEMPQEEYVALMQAGLKDKVVF
jgi:leucyl/phenylalanyl-tRNA--protein transferase